MASLVEIEAARAALAIWHEARRGGLSPLPFGEVNWTYDGDRHVPADVPLGAVVVGINPGDGNGAQQRGMSRSERTWRTRCVRLIQRPAEQIVFAELISIPTKRVADLGGGSASISEAIEASHALNKGIIAFHRPFAVYQPGLLTGDLSSVVEIYGLELQAEKPRSTKGGRLLSHYRMPSGVHWISFRHFASPGFSNDDRAEIQNYVTQLKRDAG